MHSNRPFSLFPKGVRRPSLLELKRTERKDPHPPFSPDDGGETSGDATTDDSDLIFGLFIWLFGFYFLFICLGQNWLLQYVEELGPHKIETLTPCLVGCIGYANTPLIGGPHLIPLQSSVWFREKPVKPKPAPAAISSTALKQASDAAENASKELDLSVPPIHVDPSQFNSVLHKGKDDADTNCWTSPGGTGFMIRGQTYLKNSAKIMGGNPLLKLIAVDWFKVDKATDKIALHPKSLAQVNRLRTVSLSLKDQDRELPIGSKQSYI
ncbi:hypothetical protein ES288_A11G188000v1 [Gossypium darwinii]|uniref:Protein ENHANCED DISEASE RESISTANCE 2 C-terminal domain-containing protein n=1 Tax=Gossypium darwinii TaxID=34276 RepID=A0A5D2EMT1_GOSDA|nr:hypothetical protein ES288_A11G188000v1 [Gossypium darwinii]